MRGYGFRALILVGAALLLSACAGSAALESQTRQRDARMARLYFMRETGMIGALGGSTPTADIKVDDKPVGALRNGYYLFVDRPAGLHTLYAHAGLSTAFEAEIQVEAGQSYYFNIGVPSVGGPGMKALNQAYAGGSGEMLRPKSQFAAANAAAVIYRMDPAAGADLVARLQPP